MAQDEDVAVEPDAWQAHAHGHGGTPLPVASVHRARVLLAWVLVPVALLTGLGAWLLWPDPDAHPPQFATDGPGVSYVRGDVVEVRPDSTATDQAVVRLADGEQVDLNVPPEYVPELAVGDTVRAARMAVAAIAFDPAADPEAMTTQYVFVDFVRGPPMALLAAAFALLVVLVARWRGLAALVGMAVGLSVVAGFTLPALLQGRPAIPVALVTGVAVMFAVLYLAHGVSVRTSTALAGTLVGLVATAGIAAWAGGSAHLTGLSGEYALDLMSVAPEVRLRAVLVCGMVLAGLGVLNDVTITQASAVWELHAANPGRSWRSLYSQGMRIGRDHIASTVYTIVFAYVGAALPLVLLVSLSDRDLLGLLTSGEIAEEVVRTLVGSVGLVLAIPVTTALAATFVRLSAAPSAELAGPRVGRQPAVTTSGS
ncbi:YibE/F family protein [Cellulomonas sp. S1-8]|uniref:YibE/F family protein n=1 Tax=Cellulomonas sp. S1-8 TaxID=2904790 RepID=UPI00224446D4|nr:YibE/F family protein [Cellulomonas sp. S1-8]UZN03545.1 YibE/F family protein [Cellulomonas sp. S1-8]